MADNLFFVEHFITDIEGWAGFMQRWNDILGADDMTVDKGCQYPDWEGNEGIMQFPDTEGGFTCCLWKLPSHKSIGDFKEFIDRFTCGTCTNKVYAVKDTLGAKRLDSRGFMRDWIRAAQGKESPSYLDKPMLWLTHHQITDREGWEKKMMEELAVAIRKNCNTPSDCMSLSPKGYGTALVMFLSDDACVCVDGSHAGMTKEEYQKFIEEKTKGTAKNTVYLLSKDFPNVMNLSEDTFNQDILAWGLGQ